MKTALIVSEFNPFHLGHKYLIDSVRNAGVTHIVCVMSGNWIQRGDCAIYEKHLRAQSAVINGADLVCELPPPWSMSRAQTFARGAIHLGLSAGKIDVIAFGSECGDAELLKDIARITDTEEVKTETKLFLDTGLTFTSARQKALEKVTGSDSSVLSSPNDILAMEYLKNIPSDVEVMCIKRVGASHDDVTAKNGEIISASACRKAINNGERLLGFVPENTLPLYSSDYSSVDRLDTAVLSHLRRLDLSDIKEAPDVSEGLENKIFDAVRSAVSVDELLDKIKSKRYTMARLRRIIYSLFLGIKASDTLFDPPYINVLASDLKGKEIISSINHSIPVLMRASQMKELSGIAKSSFELSSKCDRLHSLSFDPPHDCKTDFFCNVMF